MQDFSNYQVSKHFTSEKESHFYRLWVKNLYEFIGKNPGSKLEKALWKIVGSEMMYIVLT